MLTKFYTQAVSTGEDQTELSLLLVNTKKKKKKKGKERKEGRNRHYHQEVYGYLGKQKMFSFFCLSRSVLVLLFLFPPSWAPFLSPRADFKTRFSSTILYPTLTHLFSPIHLPQSLTLVCLLARVSSRTLKQRDVDLFLEDYVANSSKSQSRTQAHSVHEFLNLS